MPTKPKPKRKRVSKKKLTADEAYVMFNMMMPDDGPLASANAVYELLNDKLRNLDADGHAASREKDASLAGLIGYATLPDEQFSMRKTFPCPVPVPEIYARLAADIRALPSGTAAEESGGPVAINYPTTVGAMVMWQKPDGTVWTVFYHHPLVTARHATAILKEVADDFEMDQVTDPSGSEGASN